ncbi:MAG: cupredoxin domain-containing protein [Actinobacteria bacterium]|nr:cupredoxin domain-containing protein [Actinomycetota bacterium]
MTELQAYSVSSRTKLVVLGVIVALAFFAAYGFASTRGADPAASVTGVAGSSEACSGSSGCDSGGQPIPATDDPSQACGGCDSSAPAEKPSAAAVVADGVQRIDVDVSAGYYDPTVIQLAAGVPAVITFSQGSGCLAEVQFPDFGIQKDLTHGGAVIELPALESGEYGFNCGMEMVFGTLLVQ